MSATGKSGEHTVYDGKGSITITGIKLPGMVYGWNPLTSIDYGTSFVKKKGDINVLYHPVSIKYGGSSLDFNESQQVPLNYKK